MRLALGREHLGSTGDATLTDPRAAFAAFASSAKQLQAWHDSGRAGQRPPGQLRPYQPPHLPAWRRPVARALYRIVCDPDGRPTRMRLRNRF